MEIEIAREAVEVIEEDAVAVFLIASYEGDHIAKAGALALAARQLIAEHFYNLVAAARGIFAKACLLRSKPIALTVLLLARNPAVNNGKSLLARCPSCCSCCHMPVSLALNVVSCVGSLFYRSRIIFDAFG
ncbi:hypothetical protein [Methylobacterium sp. ARG-1]|uniref:hypothetical protein n=1 Tax=Methylobacterium sp. ARG-1 TaxID=1692501 RepID=UPI001FCD29E3|nr:hypothetical protein [Methylobacterium sp. ARG-1]